MTELELFMRSMTMNQMYVTTGVDEIQPFLNLDSVVDNIGATKAHKRQFVDKMGEDPLKDAVNCLSFDAGGKALALSCAGETEMALLDLDLNRVLRRFRTNFSQAMRCCALSTAADLAVSGSYDHTIRLWRLGTGEYLGTLVGATGSPVAVHFLSGTSALVAAFDDGQLNIWHDPETMTCDADGSAHSAIGAISPLDGFAYVIANSAISCWSPKTQTQAVATKNGWSGAAWMEISISNLVITPLALGVHEVMLEGFHVPSPRPEGLPHWAPFLDTLICLIGLVAFYRLSLPRLHLRRVITKIFILGSIPSAWLFQTVSALPQALYLFALSTAVVPIHRYIKRPRVAALCVVAGAAVFPFALKPALAGVSHLIKGMLSRFDYPQLYFEPYPKRVFVTIYLGFVEPVIAALIIAFLVWPSLRGALGRRIVLFSLLIMAIKGSLLPTLLWSFWIPSPRLTAILSEAQFGLETAVLGLLTGHMIRRRRHPDPHLNGE